MSRIALIYSIALSLLIVNRTTAQAPTLNPSQTVNLATGEMGFSLPLGVVKGINNHNFPVNLNYHAGIKLLEDASPVGLGFSYGAGSIQRKVIFLPDNCDFNQMYNPQIVYTPWWIELSQNVLRTLSHAVAMLTLNPEFAVAGAIISFGISALQMGLEAVIDNAPQDFSTGGTHDPAYNWDNSEKKGFFKGLRTNLDLPDVYFVNTPCFSGEFCWVGSKNDGHFVLKNTQGSSKTNELSTVKIEYNHTDKFNEFFKITLQDGMQLIFANTDMFDMSSVTDGSIDYQSHHISHTTTIYNGCCANVWHLTKVLYSDYVDRGELDNPQSKPSSEDKGSWVYFKYKEFSLATSTIETILQPGNRISTTYAFAAQPLIIQNDSRSVSQVFTSTRSADLDNWPVNSTLRYSFLENIITPADSACFKYPEGRLDNRFFSYINFIGFRGSSNVALQPKLSEIDICKRDGVRKRQIKFITDYYLRPHTFSSYVYEDNSTDPGNPDAACLTLRAVTIKDQSGNELPPIKFRYNETFNPPGCSNLRTEHVQNGPFKENYRYYLEERDVWGYYRANSGTGNNFNSDGNSDVNIGAAAWSLVGMSLPNGKILSWCFEENRYDMVNGVFSKADHSTKFGDGIRVSKIIENDANGKNIQYNYTYTSDGSLLENNKNSSGHATAEPYCSSCSDTRTDRGKGGLYVAGKVMYEKVKVYNSLDVNLTPNGYTQYEFVSPAMHPNDGYYGEFDRSWQRGNVLTVRTFDANNKEIKLDHNEFGYQLQAEVADSRWSAGFTYLKNKTEKIHNVESKIEFKYGFNTDGHKEDTVVIENAPEFNFLWKRHVQDYTWYDQIVNLNGEDFFIFFKTNLFGDNSLPDIIALEHNARVVDWQPDWDVISRDKVFLHIFEDIDPVTGIPQHSSVKVCPYERRLFPQLMTIQYDLTANPYISPALFINPSIAIWEEAGNTNLSIVYSNTTQNYERIATLQNVRMLPDYNGVGWDVKNTSSPPPNAEYCEKLAYNYLTSGPFKNIKVPYPTIVTEDLDGQPNYIQTKKSNTEGIVAENISAFTKYPNMKNLHMYIQPCLTLKYKLDNDILIPLQNQVTTWKSWDSGKNGEELNWEPSANYIWNVNMTNDGVASEPFPEFDFDDITNNDNSKWKLTGAIEKINKYSNINEFSSISPAEIVKTTYSSSVSGHGSLYPVAAITNAKFNECAVYTCDYDDNKNGFFDQENGWEKGGAQFVEDFYPRIFGAAVLVDGAFGPTKNICGTNPNKDYIFSAYVFPSSNAPIRFTVEPHKNNSSSPSSLNFDGFVEGLAVNKWQVVTKKITSSMLKGWGFDGNNDFLRIWIGNYPGDNNKARFYLNDIRFYPVNALIKTTYYHTVFEQLIGTIDANNIPSQRIEYDNSGRPERWEKLDLKKSPFENGYATTITTRQYHLSNELMPGEQIRVVTPNGGEAFFAGDKYYIDWSSTSQNNLIQLKKETDPTWSTLDPSFELSGYSAYLWTIPEDINGYYKIKISNNDGSSPDESDAPFFIMPTKYGALQNITPLNGSHPSGTVRFLWKGCGYTDGNITYKITIIDSNLDVHEFFTQNTYFDYNFISYPITKHYWWNITPMRNGVSGTSSPTWMFMVGDSF